MYKLTRYKILLLISKRNLEFEEKEMSFLILHYVGFYMTYNIIRIFLIQLMNY